MSDYLLKLRGASLVRQGRQILSNIDLTVNAGEIITIIGPNGAGKSSLLKLALGLTKASSGQRICLPNLRIGYMPQRMSLPETLPLTVKHFLQLAKGFEASQLHHVCHRLHIEHLLTQPMQRLSGGEFQRVLLGRALLSQPELLVLDEPVQGLDVTGQAELYELITQLKDELNCGVLMVSHDLHLVMAATDRVVCLNGHVCCEGHPQTVQQDPSYLELFGKSVPAHLVPYTHHHDHSHDHQHDENCGHAHSNVDNHIDHSQQTQTHQHDESCGHAHDGESK